MSIEDRQRWDDRHRRAGPAALPHEPIALALSAHALPPTGRALDVACGSGAVSVWLALQGFEVLGVDISPVAVAAARDLAAAHDVAATASFEFADLDDGLPTGTFDVVVCQRFRDPSTYSDLAAAVAPSGVLIVTVLSTVGHSGDPGPFRAGPGELVEAFAGLLDVCWTAEADGEAHLVACR